MPWTLAKPPYYVGAIPPVYTKQQRLLICGAGIDVNDLLVDPLSVILGNRVYAIIKLPDPSPEERSTESIRDFIHGMGPEERGILRNRINEYRHYAALIEEELSKPYSSSTQDIL
jgi:hypothetical protein